jgi:hypothetical protein
MSIDNQRTMIVKYRRNKMSKKELIPIQIGKKMLTDTCALNRLKKIKQSYEGDTEALHGKLDDFLCELLKDCGYHKTITEFILTDRWYS